MTDAPSLPTLPLPRPSLPRPPEPATTLIGAINRALDEELARDETVVLFGEDVGRRGGVFLTTEGLQAKYGRARVFDTPLAEGAIVGLALGMAVYGHRPVAEIQFADYIYPAMDQIVNQIAKIRYRGTGTFTAPLVIRTPCGGGVRGGQYHSQSPEAYFTHTPGLQVVMPSTPADARGLLKSAIRSDDPVIFFEPKRLYRSEKAVLGEADELVPIGKAALRREGHDLSFVSYGGTMPDVLRAADALIGEGVSCEVIDLRTLSPWDRGAVMTSVAKTGRVVVVNEAPLTGGFAGEICACISEELFDQLLAPPARVTGFDTPYPYALDRLYLPGPNRILRAAARVLNY